MSSVQPVTPSRHGARSWKRYTSYAFASKHSMMPLSGAEFPKAALALPIAFAAHDDGYVPVAVLGLESGQNLLVGPSGGWLAGYIPAELRGYPFLLAGTVDGQRVLCVDEGSGLVTDSSEGEAFFAPNGQLAPPLQQVFDFLSDIESRRIPTRAAIAVLHQFELIQPWELAIELEGKIHRINGLYRVNAERLDGLSDEAFISLRQHGALLLAHLQALSTQHMGRLLDLARERWYATRALQSEVEEPELAFLKSDTIRF